MIHIDIDVDAGDWPPASDLEELMRSAVNATLGEVPIALPENGEVSVRFSNDAHVQQLNSTWRSIDRPTNVLSFAANDGVAPQHWSPLLGDIVFAFETIDREARDQAKEFMAHLTHLAVHGFLHLLGYDHQNDNDAQSMEMLEIRILRELHIADPYDER